MNNERRQEMGATELETIQRHLREGWYLVEGTIKAPRGYLALKYGLATTNAVRHVVAVVHPDDLAGLQNLYPEAFLRRPELAASAPQEPQP